MKNLYYCLALLSALLAFVVVLMAVFYAIAVVVE